MTRTLLPVAIFGGCLLVLFLIVSQAYSTSQKRQVTYRYIADALPAQSQRSNLVAWRPAATSLARPFTEADAERVGIAMTEAWQLLAVAQSTGSMEMLSKGFAGPALERAIAASQDATEHGGRLAVLSQQAVPIFFHADGSIIQVDVQMEVARYALQGDDISHFAISNDQGVATLQKEIDGWRILMYERHEAQPIHSPASVDNMPFLKGFNYYPSKTPWSAFWPEFDRHEIEKDLVLMKELGANAIRIFLPAKDFFDSADRADNLENLAFFLKTAEAHQFNVIPTLFDMKHGYQPGSWSRDAESLRAVFPVLSSSTSVAFVDLKNEPDLDYDTHGTGNVQAWLKAMAALSKSIAPDVPVSIGWSTAEAAFSLQEDLDVISYHDYAAIDHASKRLEIRQDAAAGKPVVVSEIGNSSYQGIFGIPGSAKKQARMLDQRLTELAHADGILIWTLHDFETVDAKAIGHSPWSRRLQSFFGVIAANGREKPAADVVRSAFSDLP